MAKTIGALCCIGMGGHKAPGPRLYFEYYAYPRPTGFNTGCQVKDLRPVGHLTRNHGAFGQNSIVRDADRALSLRLRGAIRLPVTRVVIIRLPVSELWLPD